MATIDITLAYLPIDSYEEVVMIIKRRLSEILVNIYHKLYGKYSVL